VSTQSPSSESSIKKAYRWAKTSTAAGYVAKK
jgi:hypothetical protein